MIIEKAKEFIKKIEKQKGWCDDVDAFVLTSLYIDLFGYYFGNKYKDMEDELSYMFLQMKNNIDKIECEGKTPSDETKECGSCKIIKPIYDFSINKRKRDGRSYFCKECKNEYQRNYIAKQKNKIING